MPLAVVCCHVATEAVTNNRKFFDAHLLYPLLEVVYQNLFRLFWCSAAFVGDHATPRKPHHVERVYFCVGRYSVIRAHKSANTTSVSCQKEARSILTPDPLFLTLSTPDICKRSYARLHIRAPKKPSTFTRVYTCLPCSITTTSSFLLSSPTTRVFKYSPGFTSTISCLCGLCTASRISTSALWCSASLVGSHLPCRSATDKARSDPIQKLSFCAGESGVVEGSNGVGILFTAMITRCGRFDADETGTRRAMRSNSRGSLTECFCSDKVPTEAFHQAASTFTPPRDAG
uniref:Uncharacterized protein n=1 Tax=Palpitomonas bilix TaxID=652834 RepID=A0A7S3GCV4_9EUKA|mmetsp:Transcript_43731/g.114006  ORF Transcript_43731/g.114006 Transcript_43731/m.114006 type:complete len:288 (+) Transcript_43731:843-1706(+)